MQIDAPNRDFPRRCEKQGGMAQSVEHIVHIMGESHRRPLVAEISSAAFSCETSDLPGGQSRRLSMRIVGSSPTVTTSLPNREGFFVSSGLCVLVVSRHTTYFQSISSVFHSGSNLFTSAILLIETWPKAAQ